MKKSLAKNSLYNIIYQALNVIFPLISSIYVARILMEDGIGKVAFAQNIASYFVSLAALGFPAYGIREIAKSSEDIQDRNKTFSELYAINLISTVVFSAAYLITILSISRFRNNLILYLCAGIVILLNFANIDWLYQGLEEYGYITLRSLVVKLISLALLVLFVRDQDDFIIYALISSAGVACNYFFNLYHAHKYVNLSFKNISIGRHLKPLFIMTISQILGTIYNKIDVTMLGVMTEDANVGFYTVAHRIILIAISCCQSISAVFLPRLSYAYEKDRKAFQNIISFGTQMLIFITLGATCGIALMARDAVVLLYGERFLPAGQSLLVFAPMLLIRPLGDLLCYQVIISIGQETKRVVASTVATIANLILNYMLIPVFNQDGAAAASVVSELLVNGILLFYVFKTVKISIDKGFLFKVILSAFTMSLVVYMIRLNCRLSIVAVLCEIMAGIIIYLAVGFWLKISVVTKIVEKLMQNKRNSR